MATPPDGSFTVKEILIDLRDVVYRLETKVDRIDREGSIGQRQELDDHETRLRAVEARPIVSRKEIHDMKDDIVALNLWQQGVSAVANWKKSTVAVALSGLGLFAGIIGSVATIVWLHH